MKSVAPLIALSAIALSLPATASAQSQGAAVPAVAATRAELREIMTRDHIPGMAVAVMRGRDVIWAEAFGMANTELGAAATNATLFRIGSVSKALTGTLAARLAQAGVIDLDRPIRTYLPEWPERYPPITLRQLLGHQAGIRHYGRADYDFAASGGMIDARNYPDRASILALFANDDLVSQPGQAFHYSTFGFTLAGIVMEAATGQDFETLLRENVLDPGHITHIAVDDRFRLIPNRSASYDPVESYRGMVPMTLGPVVVAYPLNSAYKIPGGGLLSDAGSLARFGALHYAPGFLRDDIYRQVFTPQRTSGGQATDTGLGWQISTDAAGRLHYHRSGSQQGSRAHLQVYPEQRLSIAILSNLGGRPDRIGPLADAIADRFLVSARP